MGEEGAGEGRQGEGEQRGEEVQHVRQPQQQQQPGDAWFVVSSYLYYIEESPGSPASGQLCYSLGLHQSLMSPAQNMYPPCMKISLYLYTLK